MLCEFAGGARGTFEASRAIVGPESQIASTSTAPRARWAGTSRSSTSCGSTVADGRSAHRATRTVFGGDRFPYHGAFVPGARTASASRTCRHRGLEFCRAIAEGRPYRPGFAEALDWVSVQAALLRSVESARWEDVVSLRED